MPKKKTKKKSPPRPRAAARIAKPSRARASKPKKEKTSGWVKAPLRAQEDDEDEVEDEVDVEEIDADVHEAEVEAELEAGQEHSSTKRLDDLEEIIIPFDDRLKAIENGQIALGKRLKKLEAALDFDDESNSLVVRVEELEKICEALLEADVEDGDNVVEEDNDHA